MIRPHMASSLFSRQSAAHNVLIRTRWRREHGEPALGGRRAACHARTHSSARVLQRRISPLPPVRLPTGKTPAPQTTPVLVATSCPRGPASPRSPKTVAPASTGNTCQWLRKELLQIE